MKQNINDYLYTNNVLVISQFKINWKLFLYMTVAWITFIIAILLMARFSTPETSIANGNFIKSESSASGGSSYNTNGVISIDWVYSQFFLGFGITVYCLYAMVFINKILLKEVANTQISVWMTQPISRGQVILSKYLTILILISLTYLMQYIILIAFALDTVDYTQHFKNIFLGGLQTYIYIVFLYSIFFTISTILCEKALVANCICVTIVALLLAVAAVNMVLVVSQSDDKILTNLVKYFGPQILLTNVMPYINNADPKHWMVAQEQVGQIFKVSYIATEIIDKINISRFIGFNILMMVVSSLTLFGASTFFRQKSFSI